MTLTRYNKTTVRVCRVWLDRIKLSAKLNRWKSRAAQELTQHTKKLKVGQVILIYRQKETPIL